MQQRQYLQNIRTQLKLSLQLKPPTLENIQNKQSQSYVNELLSPFTQSSESSDNGRNTHQQFDQKFLLGDQIGSGAHAIVCKCFSKDSLQTVYAAKIFRTSDPEIINTIKMTFNLNKSLRHKAIVQAYELFINELTGTSYLVMEYFPHNNLDFYLKKKHKFSDTQIQKLFKNLVKAICYVHSKGIAHRDLKPDNILINPTKVELKLIDFGISKRFLIKKGQPPRDMWTRTGNIFYQAPEIFEGVGYDEKVDIWSLGVILYQLVCGRLPFQCDTIIDTIEQIQGAQLQVDFLSSHLLQDLLLRLLKKEPTKRLNINDILTHPWFTTSGDSQIKDDVSIKSLDSNNFDLDVTKSLNPDLFTFPKVMSLKQSELDVIESDDDDDATKQKPNWTFFQGIHQIHVVSIHSRIRSGTAHQ